MGPSRAPVARSPSSRPLGVDQALALTGDVVDVLSNLSALNLAPSKATAQLPDELRLVVPALHVALGEHAAARVARKIAADLDPPALHERTGLALLAEAEALERREQVHAEAVVRGEHVDVARGHARHGIDLGRHVTMGAVVEGFEPRPELRGVDVLLGPAEAAHQDRPVSEISRHVRAPYDDGHA